MFGVGVAACELSPGSSKRHANTAFQNEIQYNAKSEHKQRVQRRLGPKRNIPNFSKPNTCGDEDDYESDSNYEASNGDIQAGSSKYKLDDHWSD